MSDRRVRTGCTTCRRRRVKCDETRPICNRCKAANFLCEGYQPLQLAPKSSQSRGNSRPSSQSPPREDIVSELSWRHENWRQEQLPLYHHFVTTTVVRLFRNDHINFWRDQVAQMSYGVDIVYESLLAIAAMHRSSLLACKQESVQEAARMRVLGLKTYGKTLHLLPRHLAENQLAEQKLPVLVVLMLLTYFECFMENPKGAFRHLWAAVQLLRSIEDGLTELEISNMVPVYDAMLRLDFLAQKLVPYSCSSFLRCSDVAMMESPFWNRPSLRYSGASQSDNVAAERYRFIQLVCSHNKLSRVIWGSWCPASERPSRDELIGFHSEMLLWKANSPATFAPCDGLDNIEAVSETNIESLTIPPPAAHFACSDTALNVAMYNAYLGCALAMIATTDDDTASIERTAFRLVYQNLCISAGLVEEHKQFEDPYKPCDAIDTGITTWLHHGLRRCYSRAWQKWTVQALRNIGREGLANGFTSANTLEIMCQLEARVNPAPTEDAYLGPIRERLIPLLMPRGDSDRFLSFYLRYGTMIDAGDERVMRVIAKATWRQEIDGGLYDLKMDIYDQTIAGDYFAPERPEAEMLFSSWRDEVEKGWHGYLATEIQEGFLNKQFSSEPS